MDKEDRRTAEEEEEEEGGGGASPMVMSMAELNESLASEDARMGCSGLAGEGLGPGVDDPLARARSLDEPESGIAMATVVAPDFSRCS